MKKSLILGFRTFKYYMLGVQKDLMDSKVDDVYMMSKEEYGPLNWEYNSAFITSK